MTTRRRLIWLALLGCLLVAGITAYCLTPSTAITRAHAAQIKPGMARAEVEVILGGPARDDSTGLVTIDVEQHASVQQAMMVESLMVLKAATPRMIWRSNQVIFWARFDDAECVEDCGSFPVRPDRESVFDMMRRWFGL
jgi:hypothetical protein